MKFLIFIVSVGATAYASVEQDCFRASVYEHVPIGGTAVAALAANLDIYESVIREAHNNQVDIVVFPENGLFITPADRKQLRSILEQVPDADMHITPCGNADYANSPVLTSMSCAARESNLYVVVHAGDIVECSQQNDVSCPEDGVYLYSTQVVFDKEGMVVAKYHKYNLFGEPYDKPPVEHVVFDTPFGRMGLAICFDLLFDEPVLPLITTHKINTLLYSTHWFDQSPSLVATQFQSAFAHGNKVNVLASGFKRIDAASTGSGIFAGANGPLVSEQSTQPDFSKLLIATLPADSNSDIFCPADVETIDFTHLKDLGTYKEIFSLGIDKFETTKAINTEDFLSVCTKGMCCAVDYKLKGDDLNQLANYRLAVYNDTFFNAGRHWAQEICTFVAYDDENDKFSLFESAEFERLTIAASFSTEFIYPSVMTNGLKVTQNYNVFYAKDSGAGVGTNETLPVLNINLYGRVYSRD